MEGDLNARNPTWYMKNGAVGSIDTPHVFTDFGTQKQLNPDKCRSHIHAAGGLLSSPRRQNKKVSPKWQSDLAGEAVSTPAPAFTEPICGNQVVLFARAQYWRKCPFWPFRIGPDHPASTLTFHQPTSDYRINRTPLQTTLPTSRQTHIPRPARPSRSQTLAFSRRTASLGQRSLSIETVISIHPFNRKCLLNNKQFFKKASI